MTHFCSTWEFSQLTKFSLGEVGHMYPYHIQSCLVGNKDIQKNPMFGAWCIYYLHHICIFRLHLLGCLGTDKEEALGDEFAHEFGFLHGRRNLKGKLAKCNVPVNQTQMVLNDVWRIKNWVLCL